MADRLFFDTNVLVYAHAADEPQKRKTARRLLSMRLADQTAVLSTQVLQEYFVAVTRKLHLDPRLARRKVELLAEFDVVAPDVTDILAAIDLHRLHQLSFWDALILRAAKQGGCGTVFSENLQDAKEIDGLRIVNPFRRVSN